MRKYIAESILKKSVVVKHVYPPKDKKSAQDFYTLGMVCFQGNDLPRALENFLKAKEQHPTGPAAEMVVLVNDILNYQTKDLMNP